MTRDEAFASFEDNWFFMLLADFPQVRVAHLIPWIRYPTGRLRAESQVFFVSCRAALLPHAAANGIFQEYRVHKPLKHSNLESSVDMIFTTQTNTVPELQTWEIV
jgi:hypothetical protein